MFSLLVLALGNMVPRPQLFNVIKAHVMAEHKTIIIGSVRSRGSSGAPVIGVDHVQTDLRIHSVHNYT